MPNTAAVSLPKLIECLSQHRIARVACGLNHTLAVTAETGVVYTWGSGLLGQLGRPCIGEATPAAVMAFVETGTKIRDVVAGGIHSLYLTYQNEVYSSGSNDYGQLGYPVSPTTSC